MIRRISGVIEEWDDALPIALPGFNDSGITYQMNDAKLNGGFGINRLNCFRKAFNPSTQAMKNPVRHDFLSSVIIASQLL